MKTTQIMAVVALINVGALALHVASAQQPSTRRTELDPGVAFGKHRHPGEEIIYVLEGGERHARRPPASHWSLRTEIFIDQYTKGVFQASQLFR